MENKSEKPKHEIFESAFLGKHELMLERLSNDPEGFLYLISTRPDSFNNYLYTLENDLKLYFGPDCVKNQNGRFLKITEEFVSSLYKERERLPEQVQEILERIINLILDYYSPPEKKKDKLKKSDQPLVEKNKERPLPPISAKELFFLHQDLRLFIDGRSENQEILKQAKEVTSKYYGKLPKDSGAEKILENILNLILDYYKTKK